MKLHDSVLPWLKKVSLAAVGIAAASTLACAGSQPSPELVTARDVVSQVSNSRAAQLAPAYIVDAKQALSNAEQAFQTGEGQYQERHWAYIAQRRAQLALEKAKQEQAKRDKEQYTREYKSEQAQQRELAQSRAEALQGAYANLQSQLQQTTTELEQATAELENVRQQMQEGTGATQQLQEREAELMRERQELQTELERKEQALQQAEEARTAAEEERRAALESLKEIAQVKEEAQRTVITLSGAVLFQTGKSELLPIAERKLEQVATALKDQQPEGKIIIEGHTDSTGSQQLNDRLSKERAESVKSFLVENGVDPGMLTTRGMGESQPIANNDSPEGRANNRRVEIIIPNGPTG